MVKRIINTLGQLKVAAGLWVVAVCVVITGKLLFYNEFTGAAYFMYDMIPIATIIAEISSIIFIIKTLMDKTIGIRKKLRNILKLAVIYLLCCRLVPMIFNALIN